MPFACSRYGQVETFKAKDFGWKVAKALEDAKKKRKEARDEVERFTTRRRNWVDDVRELERDISVENGVLMKKVMSEKRMRCVALNTANVSRNDVIGFAVSRPTQNSALEFLQVACRICITSVCSCFVLVGHMTICGLNRLH